MRTLHTTFLEKPDFQEWLKEAKKAREWVTSHSQSAGDDEEVGEEEDTETKRTKKIKWSTKSNVWKKHKERLIMEYKGKCMYCEGRYVAGSHDDAEHFAPKGEVTEQRRKVDHPGYYWLAFEWQNILLACQKCNSRHPDGVSGPHPGKLNEYPVRGERVKAPGDDPGRRVVGGRDGRGTLASAPILQSSGRPLRSQGSRIYLWHDPPGPTDRGHL